MGVDVSEAQLNICRATWKKNIKSSKGEFSLMRSDAARLPFKDGCFDAVILSDIFSHPDEDWIECELAADPDGCADEEVDNDPCLECEAAEKHKGIPPEVKEEILLEALRVLHPGGNLIIANYQSEQYAYSSLRKIKQLAAEDFLTFLYKHDRMYFACPPAECPVFYPAEIVYQRTDKI